MTVLAFLLGGHLAKRLPGPRHEKDRSVAKPALTPPLRHDLAPAFALEELRLTIRQRQCDHAHEPRQPRPRHSFQAAQKSRGSFLLRGSEASGADPWKPTQRVQLDTR